MTRAYVGLGANLGDPLTQLRFACDALEASARVSVVGRSAIYRTAPIGPGQQEDYLNAVLALETDLDATQLLSALHALEAEAGRVRRERWGPRSLDLDLLLYGTMVSVDPSLTLPHPRLEERNFVLQPLADLVGHDWTLPGGRSIEAAIADCEANPITRTSLTWTAPATAVAGTAP